MLDDTKFFENTDDELDVDDESSQDFDLPANELEEQEEEKPRKGNPAIALKQEREANRQLKGQLDELKQSQAQMQAMLEQLGQRGYAPQPQVNVDDQRQAFLNNWMEKPDEVVNNIIRHAQQQSLAHTAPLLVDRVFNDAVAGQAELAEAIALPEVRQTLAPYVEQMLSNHGNLQQAVQELRPLIQQTLAIGRAFAAQQQKPAQQKAAPDRASSFAGKPSNQQGGSGVYTQQIADAFLGMTGQQRLDYLNKNKK